jgi:tetratricopeptide (TPR) repeat protein
MMFRGKINGLMAVALAVVLVFALTGCEKLRIENLRANYHFERANHLFTEGKYRQAITEYEAVLEQNPDLVQAYRFLGESYKSMYRPGVDTALNKELQANALDALNKAYEFEPNNKEIIFSLGDMYDKMRDFEQAEKLYLRILELEPEVMDNYYVLAEFYKRYAVEREELAEKAESMYLRRIETDPENPQGYAYLASYYEGILPVPEFDKANAIHDKRIKLQPENAEVWLAKGINRWSKAYRLAALPAPERLALARESLATLEKARDLDPNYPEPYSWLSVLYQSVLAKLEPEREARYIEEGRRNIERFQELRKRALERKRLEEELKKI